MAILTYRQDRTIETHMRRALVDGSTIREIVEAIMCTTTPGRQPSLHVAMPHLETLIDELARERIADGPACDRRTGREFIHGAWRWMEDNYPEYQDVRRELNRLMLMPEDGSLEVRHREIVTAAVLACRSYPTAISHLCRVVDEGGSLEEMVEGMQVAALFGGAPVFHHALPFLKQIHDEIETSTLRPA